MGDKKQAYRIVAAVGDARQLMVLLAVAAPLARSRSGRVTPLYVGQNDRRPAWLEIPAGMEDVVEHPEIVSSRDAGKGILDFARESPPDLLLLHWRGEPGRGRYLLGRTLDPVIQNAPCDVAVLRVVEDPEAFAHRMGHVRHVVVPLGGGPNASLALQIGLDLGPGVRVTAIRVANPNLGPAAIAAQWELLKSFLNPWEREERLEPHITLASNVEEGILDEAEDDCDMVLIGATRESVVDRLVFGNLPQQVATHTERPVLIVRRQDPLAVATLRRLRWRLIQGLPQLALEDRIEVYRQVRAGSRTSRDFYVLTIMSAAIASLGLLLNSTAVIIGAMLVAPLMLALLGVSLGIVQGDGWLVRVALRTTLLGSLGAILVSGAIGWIVPGDQVTSEMLGRTSPNLLDLAIALGSGAVAAYAIGRREVASALPGVAIAVALMPPLATVGLGAALAASQVALGALLLFLTNLAAIVAAGALVFLWMGFRPNVAQRERRRVFEGGILGITMLLVSVTLVLGILSISSVSRALMFRQVQSTLTDQVQSMGPEVELSDWRIDRGATPGLGEVAGQGWHAKGSQSDSWQIQVSLASSRAIAPDEITQLQQALSQRLGQPVQLAAEVIRVERYESTSPSS